MKKLISLPPNFSKCFHEVEGFSHEEWFCTSDPIDSKLGSGGGTVWLLNECKLSECSPKDFTDWISEEKRILIHSGGQSRRLPSYAPLGKILAPIPVFRWERGQRLSQNLLSVQLAMYKKIMEKVPKSINTLVASGDVCIRNVESLKNVPNADVVCYGIWVSPAIAKNHGVFVMDRNSPEKLECMLQKPSVEKLQELTSNHFFLMDIGVWLLSDRAVEVLRKKSLADYENTPSYYDLYSDFGLSLGEKPLTNDSDIKNLSVAIIPLPEGEFYHYGTSKELISSTLTIQNREFDQRKLINKKINSHPSIFVQNCIIDKKLDCDSSNIWIENSNISKKWSLSSNHILTGIPDNSWTIIIPQNICIDIVPIENNKWVVRPYGFYDLFSGAISSETTFWMGEPVLEWAQKRSIDFKFSLSEENDIQFAPLFPIVESTEEIEKVLKWMISHTTLTEGKLIWEKSEKISADKISNNANIHRLYKQREKFRKKNWLQLYNNYETSVFYQLDLKNAVEDFKKLKIKTPDVLKQDASLIVRAHNHMLRSRLIENSERSESEKKEAYSLLRKGLLMGIANKKCFPKLNVFADQIIWSRSPVRIDLAGGWTDTPPFSIYSGGTVVNLAIELNGQPPLQVYIKPCKDFHIVLKSIDLSAEEIIKTYQDLENVQIIGSPFSIPKAALILAGFNKEFCTQDYDSLTKQLEEFGSGIELTLLSTIPAGSGLGTSSILASTVLGAINDFCGLSWNTKEICERTLILEQLLTTGGGWQDQYGGAFHGIKLLESQPGWKQSPEISWLPEHLFTIPEYKECHLLYYTGITRHAKSILSEIVNSMFLNSSSHLSLLKEMKYHTLEMADSIKRANFESMGRLLEKTWEQKKMLDAGTNPQVVEQIIAQIKDYVYGCMLPGAGGGGYLYMIAKDIDAALKIKKILNNNPPNSRARFVNMTLSQNGLQVSRS